MSKHRVAIVTGGGRGMGAAIARELADNDWKVALMSPSGSAQDLARELDGVAVKGSVMEPSDLEALVDVTLETWGRIDGVVNHTAHPPRGELLEIADEDWMRGLDMMLMNVVRLSRLVTPAMERQGGGSIVNMTTFSAFEPELALPVSSTMRAAVSSFTKLYADRYAAQNIRMNCIMPGYIDSLEHKPETVERIPMRRIGRVDEIAKTVAFLLSDDAGYITGQSIRVDGGITRHV